MKIECPNCGKKNSITNKFCGECGTKLPPIENYCPTCDKEFRNGEKFCTECGRKLVNQERYNEEERKKREEEKRRLNEYYRLRGSEIEKLLINSPIHTEILLDRIYDGPKNYNRKSKIKYLLSKYRYEELKVLIDNTEDQIIVEKIKKMNGKNKCKSIHIKNIY